MAEPTTPAHNSGAPITDPSENVKALATAGLAEQDKLREAETRRVNEAIAASRRLTDSLREAETRRVNDVLAAESRRVDEQAKLREQISALRAVHDADLRLAESKRIDAIRQVDVGAVATATQAAASAAGVLAKGVVDSAEALRTQFAQVTGDQSVRIAALEKVSYQGAGEKAVSDPALAQLAADMRALLASRNMGEGQQAQQARSTSNTQWVVGVAIGIPALLLAIVEAARLIAGK